MYAKWPFFAGLVTTIGTALANADLRIGERYLALAEPAQRPQRLWDELLDEHERCQARILAITGCGLLTASNEAAHEGQGWRRRWLDALSFLQIEMLRRYRAGDTQVRAALLATVGGIAVGLRATT